MTKRTVHIFISSPSDVADERQRAASVIQRLNGVHGERVNLQAVLWEHQIYNAHRSFQEQIAAIESMDLVIGVLWKRIGSELSPEHFQRGDGNAYESGTVFELEAALACGGKPPVYVFKKTAPIFFRKETVDEEKHQADLLESWWNRTFHDADYHYLRGFEPFSSPIAFEQRLTCVIEDWLNAKGLVPKGPIWDITKDTPFPGLRSYDIDRAPVFFGRDLAIGEAVELLLQKINREGNRPVLMVIGASGSGKSSLARAGIVPRLITPGIVTGVDVWKTVIVEPAGDVVGELASRLYEALPILAESPESTPQAWRDRVLAQPQSAGGTIAWALKQMLNDDGTPKLLLLLDQLETLITDRNCRPFAAAVRSMVEQAGIWLIATLRSDRYADLQIQPDLLTLKRAGSVYDLPPPGKAEIREIVHRPAWAAGLVLEEDNERSLAQELADAVPSADALPLLQMSLARLFEQRHDMMLTLASFDAMGGVDGAIAAHADEVFTKLSSTARQQLQSLVSALTHNVIRRPDGSLGFTAKVAEGMVLANMPARRELIDTFVNARLIVRDSKQNLRLAHEAVLRHWWKGVECLEAIADAELRSSRRRQLVLAAFSVIFLLVAGSAVWFGYQANVERDRAVQAEQSRRDQFLAASFNLAKAHEENAVGILNKPEEWRGSRDYQHSILHALQAQRQEIGGKAALRLGALERLGSGNLERAFVEHWASPALKFHSRFFESEKLYSKFESVAFNSDGTLLAGASEDNRVWLWDVVRGELMHILEGHEAVVTSVAFSGDGTLLASASRDGTVQLWDPMTGELQRILEGHEDMVESVTFSSDGTLLASASENLTPRLGPDGPRFYGTVRLWNPASGELKLTLEGHEGGVNAVAFNSDGTLLASASEDRTVRLWDPASGELKRILEGHEGEVLSVAFSDSDALLASASGDQTEPFMEFGRSSSDESIRVFVPEGAREFGTVRLWDPVSGDLKHTLEGHEAVVTSVTFRGDDTLLASASRDGTVRLWDMTSGEPKHTLEGHQNEVLSVAFSVDNKLLASASWDGTVQLRDPASGELKRSLVGHAGGALSVSFSGDGALLATASWDGSVRLWNPASGELKRTLEGHDYAVTSVSFSNNSTLLASASWDGTVRLWDVASGELKETFEGHEGIVNEVAFNSDDTLLASASGVWSSPISEAVGAGMVRLWDPTTGEIKRTLQGHEGGVSSVAFSSDGTLLASGGADGMVRLWDPASGEVKHTLQGHEGGVLSVAFSSDGALLASASWDETVRLWDPASGELKLTLEGHEYGVNSVAFSNDGTLLASASDDRTVRLWNSLTEKRKRTLKGHEGKALSVAFSGDGTLLASASGDWSSPAFEPVGAGRVRLWDPTTGELMRSLQGHEGGVLSMAFTNDGALLASGSWDGSVRLWNPTTGELKRTLECDMGGVRSVAFSSDGALLAIGGHDEIVRLWDPASGEFKRTLEGHEGGVNAVAFSSDGTLLAIASTDGKVRLWDPTSGELKRTLENHVGQVYSVAFSGDGTLLASVPSDSTVRLWDPVSGELKHTLKTESPVISVAFSSDGTLLAGGGGSEYYGLVQLWDLTSGELKRTLEGHEGLVFSVAFSSDGALLASASTDGTVRLWDLRIDRLLRNGPAPSPRAALISETLQRLWGLKVDGLNILPATRGRLLPRGGYYVDQEITIETRAAKVIADKNNKPIMRTFNIRPLLNPPQAGEDKLDQLLRWLKDQDM